MHRTTTRVVLLLVGLSTLVAAEADAQWTRSWEPTMQFRFRLGLFEPAGGSAGWDNVFEGFTGDPSDLGGFVWGTDFLWRTGRHTGVLFGLSYSQGKTTSAYLDWTTADGRDIAHTTKLELSDLSAAFFYRIGDASIRPYLGVGGGFLWYRLSDQGSFIDFGSPDLPVFQAWYGAEDTTFEAFALAGVDIPLGRAWSFIFEGRYRWASDELGQDYAGFGTIDLSGWELTGGFGLNF